MLYERQFFHVQSGGNASTWIIGLRGFHETSGDQWASKDSICLSCDPCNCCHFYIQQKNSAERLCAGLICVFSVSPITRYLPQRISHIGHYWHCGKHICRNFRSTVFRIVGHCSPVATAAAEGGQYQREASRGSDDMPFHFPFLDWGLQEVLRLTVSGFLSPPRTTSKSSTHLNRAGPAGISGWQWIGVSGSLCYLLKTSVQPWVVMCVVMRLYWGLYWEIISQKSLRSCSKMEGRIQYLWGFVAKTKENKTTHVAKHQKITASQKADIFS